MAKKKGKFIYCLKCGTERYVYPYQKNTKYCSRDCANKGNASANSKSKIGAKNPMYGKKAWNTGKTAPKCGSRGEDHYNWKGGVSDESHRARASGEWKAWRKAVYERDNYTCQICKEKGGDLVPHHIKLFRIFKKDRYKTENGVTLCKRHHRGLHNKNAGKTIINI